MTETPSQQRPGGAHELDPDASAKHRLSREAVLAKRVHEQVESAWPAFPIDLQPFVERVAGLLDEAEPAEAELRRLAVADLFLAYACSLNNDLALRAFAERCDGDLRIIASRLHVPHDDFDDFRQRLWNKLFLASNGHAPKILDYSGKGELQSWFRVVAARSILDELRNARRSEPGRTFSTVSSLWESARAADPELASIRQRYKANFRQAFERAVGQLEPEERNLLKCHYILSMSTEELAGAFGTHKATAARRVARAREKLLTHTRAQLKSHLGVDSSELDSVMRLFDTEMSVSLSRLLR
jgi:RNA polymerase sigma-70 factor, ECF subfamily